ncbi:hypothetical protein BRC76_04970 [Halobacteriales archaeon QH_8_67_36]|nr:MAG: hypothetical protein BRC76_04970 [Halobacteriales archaeon QH_8_67_36]
MVEDRITDGKRIGQLFASELTGLERGPLGAVSVEDSEPDVEPTDGGAFAFRVVADGEEIGRVRVTETTARLELAATTFESEREDCDGCLRGAGQRLAGPGDEAGQHE